MWQLLLFNLFNIVLAFSFAAVPGTFNRIPYLNITWDDEIPGSETAFLEQEEQLASRFDPMAFLAVAIATIDTVIVGVVDLLIWSILHGDRKAATLLMVVFSVILAIPMLFLYRQWDNYRWHLLIGVVLGALICGGIYYTCQ